MIDNLKVAGDAVSYVMAFGSMVIGALTTGIADIGALFTLNEWAAILAINWWIYRFADDFYNKWKNSRKSD